MGEGDKGGRVDGGVAAPGGRMGAACTAKHWDATYRHNVVSLASSQADQPPQHSWGLTTRCTAGTGGRMRSPWRNVAEGSAALARPRSVDSPADASVVHASLKLRRLEVDSFLRRIRRESAGAASFEFHGGAPDLAVQQQARQAAPGHASPGRPHSCPSQQR